MDQVLCFIQFGKLAHGQIMEVMRLIGKCVILAFAWREEVSGGRAQP
jgi:hypothetical protein